MINKAMLKEITDRLIKAYNPVSIYLFGSHAWGNPHEDSDVDILIVVDKLTLKPWEAQSFGYHILFDVDVPKDLVVFPLAEFEIRSQSKSSLFYKIKQKGVMLYARA